MNGKIGSKADQKMRICLGVVRHDKIQSESD